MIKIAICDDDKVFLKYERDTVQSVLGRLFPEVTIQLSVYTTGQELQNVMKQYEVDLVFLDIELDMEDGFEVAKQLSLMNKEVKIIFVTSHENLVYQAFDCMPIGFIRKRNFEVELKHLLPRVIRMFREENQTIQLGPSDKKIEIPMREIRYIEVFNHNLAIDCGRGVVEVRDQLNHYIDLLTAESFIEISRNCVVNMKYIKKITDRDIVLLDGTKKSVSRSRKKASVSAFERYQLQI